MLKMAEISHFRGIYLTRGGLFFSLRLGHGAALTRHRRVIHSRAAASLPLVLPRSSIIGTKIMVF